MTSIAIGLASDDDTLTVDASVGPAPAVVASGGSGPDVLRGGPGPDVLRGGPDHDELFGGGGDDLLDAGSSEADGATDTYSGQAGTDTADFSARGGAVSVSLDGAANDGEAGENADVGPDVEHIVGGPLGDSLSGSDGPDVLEGRAGNDRLDGRGGDDSLQGAEGDDDIDGGDGADLVQGDAGEDSLQGGGGADSVSGAGGADTLRGGPDGDVMAGGAGIDTMYGGDGADTMSGGGPGLAGADGGDTLYGGAGPDTMHGDDGEDVLDGQDGPDAMYGDADRDTVTYESRVRPVRVALDGVPNDGEDGEGDNVAADVEVVKGGVSWNDLIGSSGSDRLVGDREEDEVDGRDGADQLVGGGAADLLMARDGTQDSVACGAGGDLAILDARDTPSDCEWVDRRGPARAGLRRTAYVQPTGQFTLRLPEAQRDHRLRDALLIPLGSRIDPLDRALRLSTASDASGALQRVVLTGDAVTVRQTAGRRPATVLRMVGGETGPCRASASAGGGRAARREVRVRVDKPSRRRGRKPGETRVRGQFVDAAAEGTEWTTTDRCDGTQVRVISGTVRVRDLVRRKVVRVRAGRSYLARRR